ncbi:MAG: Re/Si-specific NAD(P)(+) transhydrogenase subunit alpha [Verrucomicrobia bacterium]|nr:Re/Si-specific NAD(P)(+) transhydrogenase subunit alpha [Verrucomicrobiota bacterium]
MSQIVFTPRESSGETRVALTPETAAALRKLGLTVLVESNAGIASDYRNEDYTAAGAQLVTDRKSALQTADIVLRVRKPAADEIALLKPGCMHISFLDAFQDKATLQLLAQAGVTTISMEMMPRTTLAQKMDALSSQANLAGYAAVVQGAARLRRILPMMMTPAGTIAPARVFVIGVGVAGLQAIATAKRLGARVEAFDTRPVVEEQVRSLGAKFVKIDLGDTGQTAQGYARELTPEQIAKQREGMAKVCAQSDIVITTAKLFGRKAPVLLTADIIARMKQGSVIVDLAAESGGNVEGTVFNQTVTTANGVSIIGSGCLEATVATHASQVYASNLLNFISHFWDEKQGSFSLKPEDEIQKGCVLTHGGAIVHSQFK